MIAFNITRALHARIVRSQVPRWTRRRQPVVGRRVQAALFVLTVAFGASATAWTREQAPDVRVPQSAQDHLELAVLYEHVVQQERAQASNRRKLLSEELRRAAFPNKSGVELPWIVKIRRQGQSEIDRAEKAAADAQRSAEYHRMRAKELEGREFATLAARPK